MPTHDKKRPTLKTIAELTGLSLSTVSLSLRDGSNLKQSTRDKVAEAAAQIGYVPNRAGVRLRTGRTNVLALVLSTDKNGLDFTKLMIQGIGNAIHGTPFHLNVHPEFEQSAPVETVRYILESQSADGIIITHTSARDPRVKLLMEADFPFVSHGRTEFHTPHAYHDFNAERYVELAIQRLADKNRKQILLAAVGNNTTNHANTVNGFKQAIANTSLTGAIIDNPQVLNNTHEARDYGRVLAKSAQRPDGIICNNELVSLALIHGLQDEGVMLAKDYDLICKRNTEVLPMLYPEMDTVTEDLFATGGELAKLLIERINGTEVTELQTLHEPITHWRNG